MYSTRPSCASWRSASRTAPRPVPSIRARCSSRSCSPCAMSPSTIACRSSRTISSAIVERRTPASCQPPSNVTQDPPQDPLVRMSTILQLAGIVSRGTCPGVRRAERGCSSAARQPEGRDSTGGLRSAFASDSQVTGPVVRLRCRRGEGRLAPSSASAIEVLSTRTPGIRAWWSTRPSASRLARHSLARRSESGSHHPRIVRRTTHTIRATDDRTPPTPCPRPPQARTTRGGYPAANPSDPAAATTPDHDQPPPTPKR